MRILTSWKTLLKFCYYTATVRFVHCESSTPLPQTYNYALFRHIIYTSLWRGLSVHDICNAPDSAHYATIGRRVLQRNCWNRARKSRTTLQNKVRLKVLPEQLTLFVNTSVTFKKFIIQ